jgi:hypothetical protein
VCLWCEFGACGAGPAGFTEGIGSIASGSLLQSVIGSAELAGLFLGQYCEAVNISQVNSVSNLNVSNSNLVGRGYWFNGGMDFDWSVPGATEGQLPAGRYPSSIFNSLTGIGPSLHVPAAGGNDPSTYGIGPNGEFLFTTHMDSAYSTWHTPAGALTHWYVDVRNKGAHRGPC